MADRVYIALDNMPEHAAALGRMLGHWAILELFLTGLMQHLIGIDPYKADFIYKEFVSVKAKITLLRRINHTYTTDNTLKIDIDTLLFKAQKLNTKRNQFIHASWSGDPTGDLNNLIRYENILPPNHTKGRKPPMPFTLQEIQDVVEEIAELSASLGNLIVRSFVVPLKQP